MSREAIANSAIGEDALSVSVLHAGHSQSPFNFSVLTSPPSPSSVLALVTTVHLAMAAVRNHRRLTTGPLGSLAAISLIFASLPWLLPSAAGLTFGLLVHGLWFIVCERFVPKSAVQPIAPAGDVPAAQRPLAARLPPRPAAPANAFVSVPVLAVIDETPTIKTIRVARPETFEFESGQFLTVRIRIEGKEYARCYSLSSAPDTRGYLEISVRRQGLVSNALHASLRPGAMLSIKGPLGVFRYPAGDDRPLVLLAGGIGITPLMSMLRHALSTAPSRPVTLLYSARSEADFAFQDELLAIARRHPQVVIHFAVSSGGSGPRLYPGHIDEALVRTTVPHLTDSICFICGPTPMIEGMRTLLSAMQVPAAQIRHEVFNAAVAASSSREPESPATAHPQRPSGATARTTSGAESHRMACQESGRSVTVGAGQTLLEAAENADVQVLSLCRAGVCGTCRVRVTDGDVDCASDALAAEELAQGFVLACVTTAKSDCTVQI